MKRPNILWICTDQQRFDTIRCLGNRHIHTPCLDKLASQGVAFTHAFAQSPLCTPSRASFLTGRYPRTTGVRQNGNDAFPADEPLVTRKLADAGYVCGLIGKLHLAAACGRIEPRDDDGYSKVWWNHHPHPDREWETADAYQQWLKGQGVAWGDIYKPQGVSYPGAPEHYHQSHWCAEKAIEFIDHTSEPWCLSINPYDPHHAFDAPPSYLNKYNPDSMPLPAYKPGELDNKPMPQKVDNEKGAYGGMDPQLAPAHMTERTMREITANYYAMIEFLDHEMGRIIAHLDATGKRKNTVVIFMSDHGEMLGDHGIYLKGCHMYDAAVRVPLIISWPGHYVQGARYDGLVELVDIAPTLYDATGIEAPAGVQGVSLSNALHGRNVPHKDAVYCECYNGHVRYDGERIFNTMYRDVRCKVVVYHGREDGELYDLVRDPFEFENLWDNPLCKDLRAEYTRKCFDLSMRTIDPLPLRVAPW